jgi:hypothetical protein
MLSNFDLLLLAAAARIPDEHGFLTNTDRETERETERERKKKEEEEETTTKLLKTLKGGKKKTSNFIAKLNSFQKSLHTRALKL